MENKDEITRRLKSIAGHIRGIERMVESDAYCIDVIQQTHAAQAAINKVASMILESHLNSCLITAVQGDDVSERERVLQEISSVFEAATRV